MNNDKIKQFFRPELTEDCIEELESLSSAFVGFASLLEAKLPEGIDKSVAFTQLETCYMWAKKAISFNI